MTEKENEIKPYEWMIRTCEEYEDEYKNCKSFKDRFHQYFVFGEMKDCNPWKQDLQNCLTWKETRNEEAYNEIIASEKIRREERLTPHIKNNVWTRRDKPPENWDAPLPEWMQEKLKNTYLSLKSQEMQKLPSQTNSCNIL